MLNEQLSLSQITNFVKQQAFDLGFDLCGVTSVDPLMNVSDFVNEWLAHNYHADMHYMSRNVDKRCNPALLVEGAKSIIVVGLNYYTNQKPNADKFVVAKYAYSADYHKIIKDKLFELLQKMNAHLGSVSGRCFTDSAPVLERALAQRAGLGWHGRNSLLISPQLGSFFFIGTLFVDIDLLYDKPFETTHCGTCRRCMDACPTAAIFREGCVDSRRCISYQTIENKGDIDEDLRGLIAPYVFGCDVCQNVCPWNSKAKVHDNSSFPPNPRLLNLSNDDWMNMTEQDYLHIFSSSAIDRARWKGINRNIAACKLAIVDNTEK